MREKDSLNKVVTESHLKDEIMMMNAIYVASSEQIEHVGKKREGFIVCFRKHITDFILPSETKIHGQPEHHMLPGRSNRFQKMNIGLVNWYG